MNPCSCLLTFLAVTTVAEAAVLSWDGSSNGDWTNGANWVGNVAPIAGDDLFFGTPAAGGTKVMNNNFAIGTDFASLQFFSGNYTLAGNRIDLTTGGITNGVLNGNATINTALRITTVNQAFNAPGASATLTYGGNINTNGLQLTFEGDGTHVVNNGITGTGSVLKREEGTLRLFGANTPSGGIAIDGGIVDLRGSAGGGDVAVRLVGKLMGDGTVTSNVTVVGELAPGVGAALGDLAINGNVTFSGTGSRIAVFEAGEGGAVDASSLTVGGSVNLAGANFDLNVLPGFVAAFGKTLTLIQKTSAGAISGTFGGIAAVQVAVFDGVMFRFSYTGGDGNDFTATVLPTPSTGVTRTWTGAGANNKWSNPANWGGTAPKTGDSLNFPAGLTADKLDADNDFDPAITAFFQVTFAGGGYLITGNALLLTHSILHTAGSGSVVLDLPLRTGNGNTLIRSTGSGSLVLRGSVEIGESHVLIFEQPSDSIKRMFVEGSISGPGFLVTRGLGGPVLTGTQPNTYSGSTTVESGALFLEKAGAIPDRLTVRSGFVAVNTSGCLPDTGTVTLEPEGQLILHQPERIGTLVMDGGTVLAEDFPLSIQIKILVVAGGDPFSVDTANHIIGDLSFISSVAEIEFFNTPGAGLFVQGALSGTGANQLDVSGDGTLWFDGENATTPIALRLEAGTHLFLVGTNPCNNPLELAGGYLGGHGAVGSLTAASGAAAHTVAPESVFDTGTFKCASLQLNAATLFSPVVNQGGNTPHLQVTGGVALGNATLSLVTLTDATPVGSIVTLVSKASAGPVTGTFTGLPEGTRIVTPTTHFVISYAGGDGNETTLTSVRPTAGATFTWDGDGASPSSLSAAQPWVGNVVPPVGSHLTFPTTALSRTITTGFGDGFIMHSLTLGGGGYLLDLAPQGPDDFILMSGLTDNHAGSANRFTGMLSLDAAQTYSVLGTGALQLDGGVDTNSRDLMLDVRQVSAQPLLRLGTIIGGGILRKRGAGAVELVGSLPNTCGDLECIEGQMRLAKSSGVNVLASGKTLRIGSQSGPPLPVLGDPIPAVVTMANANLLPDDTHVEIRHAGRWEVTQPETIGSLTAAIGELHLTSTLTSNAPLLFESDPNAPQNTTRFTITGNGTIVRTGSALWDVAARTEVTVQIGVSLQPPSGSVLEIAGPGTTKLFGGHNLPNGIAVGANSPISSRRQAIVEVSGASAGTPFILQGGTLTGYATLGEIRGTSLGGRIDPYELGDTGDVIFPSGLRLNASGATTLIDLDIGVNDFNPTNTPESDKITTSGIVELGNALPRLRFKTGYLPEVGDTFLIISKTSPGAITQPFLGLPEGGTLVAGAAKFHITYVGGNGNDVVLTSLGAPEFKIDSLSIAPRIGGGPGKNVSFTATGLPGALHIFEASDNLIQWTTLAELRASELGVISANLSDPAATGPTRFYRIRYQVAPL